jgi:hypothetical protein
MIRILLALLATVMTAVQSLLIYTRGKGFCFNNGCEIVESMTTVPPLYFNLAGCLFFMTIFWCLVCSRNGSEYWLKFARIILLAGLVGEAVLVFFQYSVANVFCSYCLIVLSFIVLLNVLCGPRQIFRGIVLFSAVFLTCLSLQFSNGGTEQKGLAFGALAVYQGEEGAPELTLFFSSTCAHCERVIESLAEDNRCSVSFNPIEEIKSFEFDGAVASASYNPGVNLGFLINLGIAEIPVMIVQEDEEIRVLRGGVQIDAYLKESCQAQETVGESNISEGISQEPQTGFSSYLQTQDQQDDNCRVDADCDEEPVPVPVTENEK